MIAGIIATWLGEAALGNAWKRLRPILFNTTTLLIAVGCGLFLYGRHVGSSGAEAACREAQQKAVEAARAADADIAAENRRRAGALAINRRAKAAANQEAVDEIRTHASAHPSDGDALTAADVRRLCAIGGCRKTAPRR